MWCVENNVGLQGVCQKIMKKLKQILLFSNIIYLLLAVLAIVLSICVGIYILARNFYFVWFFLNAISYFLYIYYGNVFIKEVYPDINRDDLPWWYGYKLEWRIYAVILSNKYDDIPNIVEFRRLCTRLISRMIISGFTSVIIMIIFGWIPIAHLRYICATCNRLLTFDIHGQP